MLQKRLLHGELFTKYHEKAENFGFKVVYADTDGFYAILDNRVID